MAEPVIEAAAVDDLIEIVDNFMSHGKADYAETLYRQFFESASTLKQFPYLGSPDPDTFLAARGYRRFSVGTYWCYYLIIDDTVRIMRILKKGHATPVLP